MITIAGPNFVAIDVIVTSPARDHIRSLRQGIEVGSRARYSLLHENAHLLLNVPPNYTGITAVLESVSWLAGLTQTDTALTVAFDRTLATVPWSRRISAPVSIADYAQSSDVGHCPPTLRTFRVAALPAEDKPALVRLLDGILAALGLMLILVLAALTRHPNVLTFVLIMLAACLCFGRRGEPDDHAFLPMRRYQTSLGSCLHG